MQYILLTHIPCLQAKLQEKHVDRFEQGLCAETRNMYVLQIILNGKGKPHPILPHIARSTRCCCRGPDHTTPKLGTGWNGTISQKQLRHSCQQVFFPSLSCNMWCNVEIRANSLLYPSSTFPIIKKLPYVQKFTATFHGPLGLHKGNTSFSTAGSLTRAKSWRPKGPMAPRRRPTWVASQWIPSTPYVMLNP